MGATKLNDRHNRLREIAYFFWEEEGRPSGQDKRHWQMAESVLDQEEAGEAERKVVEGEPPGENPDISLPKGASLGGDVNLPPMPTFQR